MKKEKTFRQSHHYPPYGELCVIKYKNENETTLHNSIQALTKELLYLQQSYEYPDLTIYATDHRIMSDLLWILHFLSSKCVRDDSRSTGWQTISYSNFGLQSLDISIIITSIDPITKTQEHAQSTNLSKNSRNWLMYFARFSLYQVDYESKKIQNSIFICTK